MWNLKDQLITVQVLVLHLADILVSVLMVFLCTCGFPVQIIISFLGALNTSFFLPVIVPRRGNSDRQCGKVCAVATLNAAVSQDTH